MTSAALPTAHRITKPLRETVKQLIQSGLVLCVWFCVFARGAHDLWALTVLCGAITLLSVIYLVFLIRSSIPVYLPLWKPLIALLAYLVITLPHSFDFSATRQEIWGMLCGIIAFYLWVNTIDTMSEVHRFFLGVSWVMLPLAILCLHEQWTGHPVEYRQFHLLSKTFTVGQWEIHGTMVNSIVLSSFALSMFFFLWEARRQQRWALPPLIATFILLALGRSWWAFVSLTVGMAYFKSAALTLLWRRHQRRALMLAMTALLLILFTVFVKFGTHSAVVPTNVSTPIDWNYSGSNRISWWGSSLQMMRHSPWIGVGSGAFQVAYPHFRESSTLGTRYAHSFFLQVGSEWGLCGALLLLWLVVSIAKMRKNPDHDTVTSSPIEQAAIATLITLTLYASINISLEFLVNKWILLFWIGALLPIHPGLGIRIRRPIWLLPLGALFLCAVPFWLAPFKASQLAVEAAFAQTQGDRDRCRKLIQNAISLDPHNGDYFSFLANTYQADYLRDRNPTDYDQWKVNLTRSVRWKKQVRLLRRLDDMSPPPPRHAS